MPDYQTIAADLNKQAAALDAVSADLRAQAAALVAPLPPPPVSKDLIILVGQTVTLSGDATYDNIDVAGTLRFDPAKSITLKVINLTLHGAGLLDIQPQAGCLHQVIFRDVPLSPGVTNPMDGGLVSNDQAKTLIIGEAKTEIVRLAVAPKAGDATLALSAAPFNWQIGDEILIADSELHAGWAGWKGDYCEDVVKVAGINGAVVTLDAPLPCIHPASLDGKLLPHVCNLTRNVVFTSENPIGVRGHVMFMDQSDVTVQNAAFVELGRTTIAPPSTTNLARYACHLHHVAGPVGADGYKYRIAGCVMRDAPGSQYVWGCSLHDSDGGLFARNISYGKAGAGFAVEERGSQIKIDGNFVCRVLSNGQSRDIQGRAGVGFWFENGTDCEITNNIANACAAFGYDFSGGGPYRKFEGNESYGNRFAWTNWRVNGADTTNPNPAAPMSSIVKLASWNDADQGAGLIYPFYQLTFDDLAVIGGAYSGAWFSGDYRTNGVTLNRPKFLGCRYGIFAPLCDANGSQVVIDSPTIGGATGAAIVVQTQAVVGGGGWLPKARETRINNPTFAGNAWDIQMVHKLQGGYDLSQPDRVFVNGYVGPDGQKHNIRVYYKEQDPNGAAIAYGGELAPANAQKWPKIDGLVEVLA